VLSAYASSSFDDTAWKRELRRDLGQQALLTACRSWLGQRAASICNGRTVGKPRWLLVGSSPLETPLVFGLTPVAGARELERELPLLATEAGFAHEHYIACTPFTALDYLARAARADGALRWDPFVLDRHLRSAGIGLLLLEPEGLLLYLPARYHPTPVVAPRPRFAF
jgi:hypothetical protein